MLQGVGLSGLTAYGVSGPIAGAIASWFGYAGVYLFGGACALLGAMLAVTARSRQP
jgi:hypothetical protein